MAATSERFIRTSKEDIKKYKKRSKRFRNWLMKIRRGKSGSTGSGNKNAWWTKDTGETKKRNMKLSSFRENPEENKKLQEEFKDRKKSTTTYKRVTKDNKKELSNIHTREDSSKTVKSNESTASSSKKVLGTETEKQYLERTKNSPAAKAGLSDAQRWAARQNYLAFLARRKEKKNKKK